MARSGWDKKAGMASPFLPGANIPSKPGARCRAIPTTPRAATSKRTVPGGVVDRKALRAEEARLKKHLAITLDAHVGRGTFLLCFQPPWANKRRRGQCCCKHKPQDHGTLSRLSCATGHMTHRMDERPFILLYSAQRLPRFLPKPSRQLRGCVQ